MKIGAGELELVFVYKIDIELFLSEKAREFGVGAAGGPGGGAFAGPSFANSYFINIKYYVI
jgi:hypothetical protein